MVGLDLEGLFQPKCLCDSMAPPRRAQRHGGPPEGASPQAVAGARVVTLAPGSVFAKGTNPGC